MNMKTIQTISSAQTSISTINQIYKLLPKMGYQAGTTILDFGCGKYNKNKEYANDCNYLWFGYDPYNRTKEYNDSTLCWLNNTKPNIIICSNVLNVLENVNLITSVLNDISNYASDDTDVYITIYEGDKSGVGKVTTKGYQRNEKLHNYKEYISTLFNVIDIKGNILKCRKVL